MTEIELMKILKQYCKKPNDKIIVADYMQHLTAIEDLIIRGCIKIDYNRDKAVITYLKDIPDNPVGLVDESDPKTKQILAMLKTKCRMKDVAKKFKISMNKISECKRYLVNKGELDGRITYKGVL